MAACDWLIFLKTKKRHQKSNDEVSDARLASVFVAVCRHCLTVLCRYCGGNCGCIVVAFCGGIVAVLWCHRRHNCDGIVSLRWHFFLVLCLFFDNIVTVLRRRKYVTMRGRCVSCYVMAPASEGGGRKLTMTNGKLIPQAAFACDVCRVHLCRDCFFHVYDHHKCGKLYDSVILK